MSNNNVDNGKALNDLEPLPEDFTPGDRDVVIGKGKKYFHHAGNRFLRDLIGTMLEEYSEAQTKPDKSNIITDVVEHVRKVGRFVKRDATSGKWVHAEDLLCREKCSQTFRDHLAQTYRSSNTSKKFKRRCEVQRYPSTMMLQEDALWLAPEPKRMRFNPEQRAPSPSPTFCQQHLFEWELSPLSPKPMIFNRRASGLNGNVVNLLVDAFGSFHPVDNEENPFEPTPLSSSTLPPQTTLASWPSLPRKADEDSLPSFEPRALLDSFQPLRSEVNDVATFEHIFAPDLEGDIPQQQCLFYQQYQFQQKENDCDALGPNIAAAFAA